MTASEIRPHLLSEIFKEYFLILRNVTFVNASDFIEKIKWFEKTEVENAPLGNLIIYKGIFQTEHKKYNFLHISCNVQNIAVASLQFAKPLVNVKVYLVYHIVILS